MWSLNLNLVFKPTPFKSLLAALAQITAFCHITFMHHIVALHWLCPSLFAGNRPLSDDDVSDDVIDDTDEELYYLQKCQASKNPLFISIQSHSLAPALFYCITTTTIHLLLAVVVEPLSSAWPVIATVNRWNPLVWVGFVWAMMCLLVHAYCHACYCLELSPVWFIRDELEWWWTCPTVCEHDLVKVSMRGHVGVHGGLFHWSRP